METSVASLVVLLAEAYLALGLVFAIAFASFGVGRIDPAAHGATLGFRLLIVPGSALLWPLLLRRWLRRQQPPSERNAHRDAVARAAASRAQDAP
jgi:hypothetical protein